jgi:hypothetical protein
MTDRDIVGKVAALVDDIDALVDDQLAGGEPETGYDFDDPTFPDCPHSWCSESWHGLAITRRMRDMRWRGEIDPDYRYNEDDSTVLCPGSDFTGEFTPPESERPAYPQWIMSRYSWEIPEDPLDGSSWVVPEIQFPRVWFANGTRFHWGIDPTNLRIELHTRTPEPEPDPTEVPGEYTQTTTSWANAAAATRSEDQGSSPPGVVFAAPAGVDPFGDLSGFQPLGTIVEPGAITFQPDSPSEVAAWASRDPIRTDISREFTVEFQVDPAVTASAATGPWYAELINQLHRRTGNVNEGQQAA